MPQHDTPAGIVTLMHLCYPVVMKHEVVLQDSRPFIVCRFDKGGEGTQSNPRQPAE